VQPVALRGKFCSDKATQNLNPQKHHIRHGGSVKHTNIFACLQNMLRKKQNMLDNSDLDSLDNIFIIWN